MCIFFLFPRVTKLWRYKNMLFFKSIFSTISTLDSMQLSPYLKKKLLITMFLLLSRPCCHSPAVEAAVDDGVVHGGAHRQPQHWQVNLLDVLPLVQWLVKTRHNEVDMEGEPAESKGHHHYNHHLHHLGESEKMMRDIHKLSAATWGFVWALRVTDVWRTAVSTPEEIITDHR